jgi:three-Cys-motif partner protein
MDSGKADDLRTLIGERSDVTYLCGDCNVVLPQEVLPHVQYRDFMRGLCLLDPYGFHLDWSILQKMGEMGSIDIFFNFSTMDIKMNAVRDDPDAVAERQKKRMNKAWGDSSWETCLYGEVPDLFDKDHRGRISMADPALASAFRKRLRTVAGFKYVPEPVAMRNKASAIVYYLFFASQQPVANRIVEDIFGKWRNRA